MSRLIAVSNRVAAPKGGKSAGGLAVGVLAALRERGGIWFGWSGKTTARDPGDPKLKRDGEIEFATIRINKDEFERYYNGFSNDTLWPLLHYMLGFFRYSRAEYEAYRRVNELFARKLVPLLQADDLIWVHDFHLFLLGAALRRMNVAQPIGFFLHVPFPSFDVLRTLPGYEGLLSALASYDVVGFQTESDLTAFHDCLKQAEIGGEVHGGGRVTAFGRTFTAGAFPIGIDVDECRSVAVENFDSDDIQRLAYSLRARKFIVGVDRLDYSKGLELRFRGYETLLERYPAAHGNVVYLQIAPPTRTGVRTYESIREELERAAGNINGRFAEIDWVPIRYLNRGYPRERLMSILRLADVGVVTPIRDGMNLVAKEFVASQNPDDPGMPVISTLCGAADELDAAVLVNPYDRQGVADGLQSAIAMPVAERRERYQTMIDVLRRNDIHEWCRRFVESLQESGSGQ